VKTVFPAVKFILGLVAAASLAYAWLRGREAQSLRVEVAVLKRKLSQLENK